MCPDWGAILLTGNYFLNFLKPDEVEMMSVPLSISEWVSVVQDPVKVARGEAWADLVEWKTDLPRRHIHQSSMMDHH